MTAPTGVLVIFGCLASIFGAAYFWKHIPYAQCPRCESYNVQSDDELENVEHCHGCGHTWKTEEN